MGIGLDRVVDLGVGQDASERLVVGLDDVQVEDEEGRLLVRAEGLDFFEPIPFDIILERE